MDRKLLINCTHNTVLRLLPAMNISPQQVHDGCDILAQALKEHAG
jgi:acetylornithine/succinyldiaminopimelate/putrescine aminotransferase